MFLGLSSASVGWGQRPSSIPVLLVNVALAENVARSAATLSELRFGSLSDGLGGGAP